MLRKFHFFILLIVPKSIVLWCLSFVPSMIVLNVWTLRILGSGTKEDCVCLVRWDMECCTDDLRLV